MAAQITGSIRSGSCINFNKLSVQNNCTLNANIHGFYLWTAL